MVIRLEFRGAFYPPVSTSFGVAVGSSVGVSVGVGEGVVVGVSVNVELASPVTGIAWESCVTVARVVNS